MELKRRISLAVMLVAVGLAAGHLVQNRAARQAEQARMDSTPPDAEKPEEIVQLSAGKPDTPILAPAPAPLPPVPPQAMAPAPAEAPPPPSPESKAETACVKTLELVQQPAAMIGLALDASCHPGERVVLRHGGLAVTAKTSSLGTLFVTIPAMNRTGEVSVLFSDGTTAEAAIPVPELAGVRRFAVQWMAEDAFQIHAFEGGADYGMPGHVSAADPHRPGPQKPGLGDPAKGGFLTLMGDDDVTLPMLAEVYTFPLDANAQVDLVVEAAVTEQTCGRELLGETLASVGGDVLVTDLNVAMPGCDAEGDILVLKNLVPDLKIAATMQ